MTVPKQNRLSQSPAYTSPLLECQEQTIVKTWGCPGLQGNKWRGHLFPSTESSHGDGANCLNSRLWKSSWWKREYPHQDMNCAMCSLLSFAHITGPYALWKWQLKSKDWRWSVTSTACSAVARSNHHEEITPLVFEFKCYNNNKAYGCLQVSL